MPFSLCARHVAFVAFGPIFLSCKCEIKCSESGVEVGSEQRSTTAGAKLSELLRLYSLSELTLQKTHISLRLFTTTQ